MEYISVFSVSYIVQGAQSVGSIVDVTLKLVAVDLAHDTVTEMHDVFVGDGVILGSIDDESGLCYTILKHVVFKPPRPIVGKSAHAFKVLARDTDDAPKAYLHP